jgi:hypothetical protein
MGELAVDPAGELVELLANMFVGVDLAARRRRDLQKGDAPAPIVMLFEEAAMTCLFSALRRNVSYALRASTVESGSSNSLTSIPIGKASVLTCRSPTWIVPSASTVPPSSRSI